MVGPADQGPAVRGERHARIPANQRVEREALKLLIQAPEICRTHLEKLTTEAFATPAYQKVFDLIREPGVPVMARAQERGETLQKLVAALSVESPESAGEPTSSYADHVFLRLEEFALSRRIDAMRISWRVLWPLGERGFIASLAPFIAARLSSGCRPSCGRSAC